MQSQILDSFDFRIVVNSNPLSRENVLNKGNFCLRANPFRVDINRNWDHYFGKEIKLKEEYCGDQPFSEIETSFVKEIIEDYKPFVFITVHSGSMAFFYPYAYLKKNTFEKTEWGKSTKKILKYLMTQYCQKCLIGPPHKSIGYQASGNSMDYLFEKSSVPISLAWEIYELERFPELIEYRKNIKKRKGEIGDSSNLGNNDARFKEVSYSKENPIKYDNLLGSDNVNMSELENLDCFTSFNPSDKEDYDFTMNHWLKVFKDFFILLSKEVIKQELFADMDIERRKRNNKKLLF